MRLHRISIEIRAFFDNRSNRLLCLFGAEGLLLQYLASMGSVGNNLYATYMGATDMQIALIQTIPCVTALLLMLPVGMLDKRQHAARTLPSLLLYFMAAMYIGYGSAPAFGTRRMTVFFVFLAMTTGVLAAYNAQWQSFFGEVVPPARRNDTYAFRNRFSFLTGLLTPLLIATVLGAQPETTGKLFALRILFYTCGIAAAVQGFVISRVPCPARTDTPRASLRDIGDTIRGACASPRFMRFLRLILFFYFGWHIDWSMWYIGQVQYLHMDATHLSLYNILIYAIYLVTIGRWARCNRKRGEIFTFRFGILGLLGCPLIMMLCSNLPLAARPWTFIVLAGVVNLPQACTNLCLVQMLLRAVPERNRTLTISLYTMLITLGNSLLPLLGVRYYTWLGANARALLLFNGTVAVLRLASLLLFHREYKRNGGGLSDESLQESQSA